MSHSSQVDIYSISDGSFLRSISEIDIQSVAVKDTDIYIVTSAKVRKYSFAGEFVSEFSIEGAAEDCVII